MRNCLIRATLLSLTFMAMTASNASARSLNNFVSCLSSDYQLANNQTLMQVSSNRDGKISSITLLHGIGPKFDVDRMFVLIRRAIFRCQQDGYSDMLGGKTIFITQDNYKFRIGQPNKNSKPRVFFEKVTQLNLDYIKEYISQLSIGELQNMQEILNFEGLYNSSIDGIFGTSTFNALKRFVTANPGVFGYAAAKDFPYCRLCNQNMVSYFKRANLATYQLNKAENKRKAEIAKAENKRKAAETRAVVKQARSDAIEVVRKSIQEWKSKDIKYGFRDFKIGMPTYLVEYFSVGSTKISSIRSYFNQSDPMTIPLESQQISTDDLSDENYPVCTAYDSRWRKCYGLDYLFSFEAQSSLSSTKIYLGTWIPPLKPGWSMADLGDDDLLKKLLTNLINKYGAPKVEKSQMQKFDIRKINAVPIIFDEGQVIVYISWLNPFEIVPNPISSEVNLYIEYNDEKRAAALLQKYVPKTAINEF